MRLKVHGKHFHLDGKPHFLRTVTYGPFPPESDHRPEKDFPLIRDAGFDSIRIYFLPDKEFLDAAARHDLIVIATHAWAHGCDFINDNPGIFYRAKESLVTWLSAHHWHPGLGAVLVGNEIPPDMAHWMDAHLVNQHLDELIRAAQKIAFGLPIAYASYPSTEFLEPPSADFTAFNIYLEDPEAFASYLPRLHHLAGDRPVFLTEFGMDTQSNSEEAQAELLPQALKIARAAGLAGATLYAWSDDWFNNGTTITDWSFGLTRRDGSAKPVLEAVKKTALPIPLPSPLPKFSVIVCTRNGASRLAACIAACRAIDYPDFEIIVVNDGSDDDTACLLDRLHGVRGFHLDPCGLSAARNYGAAQATGEILAYTDDDCLPDVHWLSWLAYTYATTDHQAIGGPNLPPLPDSLGLALTTSAPGAPTHVMLSDTLAEHLPGCHLSVRKKAFDDINGFDPIFETAGDDVDFCWRLRDAGHTLGFSGGSFVWHHRRATPWRYLKQQMGYGQAEALLFRKHPDRFSDGGIRWEGFVYQGSPISVQLGDVIYSGPTGEAGYQSIAHTRWRLTRELAPAFNSSFNRLLLRFLSTAQKHLRVWARKKHGGPGINHFTWPDSAPLLLIRNKLTLINSDGLTRHHLYRHLLAHGWEPSSQDNWDLHQKGIHLRAATEQTGSPCNRTFVAFTHSHPPSDFLKLASEAGFALHDR